MVTLDLFKFGVFKLVMVVLKYSVTCIGLTQMHHCTF